MKWFEQTNLKIYFCEISKRKSCERPNKYLDQFILQFLHFIFVNLHVTWVCLQSLFECSCKSKKCTYPITQNSLWVSRSGPYRASLLWWFHSVDFELYLCSFLDYYCLQLWFVSRLLKLVLTSMIKHKSIEFFLKKSSGINFLKFLQNWYCFSYTCTFNYFCYSIYDSTDSGSIFSWYISKNLVDLFFNQQIVYHQTLF